MLGEEKPFETDCIVEAATMQKIPPECRDNSHVRSFVKIVGELFALAEKLPLLDPLYPTFYTITENQEFRDQQAEQGVDNKDQVDLPPYPNLFERRMAAHYLTLAALFILTEGLGGQEDLFNRAEFQELVNKGVEHLHFRLIDRTLKAKFKIV